MAQIELHSKDFSQILRAAPQIVRFPAKQMWLDYDAEADVLYINFKKPSHATDSELTDNDIIVRYEGEAVIGLTVLHASTR